MREYHNREYDVRDEIEMRIWVDADACPNVVKEILFRAARRVEVALTLAANQPVRVPKSPLIQAVQVPAGFDAADKWIEEQVAAGDLVITADIPLAAAVIGKGAQALDPRGELLTSDNIRARLTMRDFMDQMRSSGVMTGGPSALSQRDRKAFANRLDSILARR